jgi:site-specific DNA-methyltransferase (adenine-specific)
VTVTHLTGDVLDQLAGIPDGSVDLVATSPPFLALRDYNGLPGQWGSEPDPAAFLDHLLELTAELRRVLAPHGSIAIELGDSYAGSGGHGGDYLPGGWRDGQPTAAGPGAVARANRATAAWPLPKSLCLTPELYAASLAYGRNLLNPAHAIAPWRVRNLIVWARNNPPVGALGDKVRPAVSYITVACPSGKRWFDLDAVRTEGTEPHRVRRVGESGSSTGRPSGGDHGNPDKCRVGQNPAGAPPNDHWHDPIDGDLLWLINTQGSSLAHYAMWPPRLVERLILSMCPAEVCRECGEPRRRITGPAVYVKPDGRLHQLRGDDFPSGTLASGNRRRVTGNDNGNMARVAPTLGWSDCGHDNYRPGHVLDTFAGTGTTLAVADIHGRDATGIDLDPANPALYPTRYAQCWAALKPDAGPSPVSDAGQQLGLAL